MPLLSVRDLTLWDSYGNRLVDSIHFELEAGQWFSIIGESGSGKSLTALALAGLQPKGIRRDAGHIRFQGQELAAQSESAMRALRGKEIAYVFQDYQSAFTPYRRLGRQMDEIMQAHTSWSAAKRTDKVLQTLNEVGLAPEKVRRSYPFQLSGGQLQRAALASAMLLQPKLLIADEPTTALDAMSAQKVLCLLATMQKDYDCAVLFISHDLRCVRRYTDAIAIMQRGSMIEIGSRNEVLHSPKQRYTRHLLASIPPLHNPPQRLPVFLTEYEGG
jgi:peptide/nickel transport system ATP-binding protein